MENLKNLLERFKDMTEAEMYAVCSDLSYDELIELKTMLIDNNQLNLANKVDEFSVRALDKRVYDLTSLVKSMTPQGIYDYAALDDYIKSIPAGYEDSIKIRIESLKNNKVIGSRKSSYLTNYLKNFDSKQLNVVYNTIDGKNPSYSRGLAGRYE